MKHIITVLAVWAMLALCSTSAQAQRTPVAELFAGGNWLRADLSSSLAPYGLAHVDGIGWSTSITENVTNWFGCTADFNGSYTRPTVVVKPNAFGPGEPSSTITFSNGINTGAYTFMFGPTVAYRRGSNRIVPFGRFLVGDGYAMASTTSKGAAAIGESLSATTHNHVALSAGGGIDVALSPLVAVRATGDWIYTTFPDGDTDRQNNFRVAAGLVFRFGTK